MTYRPDTLDEFAKVLRATGDYRESEFGTEILELLDLREIEEAYGELCGDIEHAAPDSLKDKPLKALEWLTDRSAVLAEIEEQLDDSWRTKDADDEVKALLDFRDDVARIIGAPDKADDETILGELEKLLKKLPPATEYVL